jgi:hypothetical protein
MIKSWGLFDEVVIPDETIKQAYDRISRQQDNDAIGTFFTVIDTKDTPTIIANNTVVMSSEYTLDLTDPNIEDTFEGWPE